MAMKDAGPENRSKVGKAERDKVKPSALGTWIPATDRPDPMTLLIEQGKNRVQKLLPIRYGRMSDSPFRFYRGAAAIMAWDLGNAPSTTLKAQCCGDAHVSNFGVFATPERRLIFDLNDFDETFPAPFEWDVKRLAASIVICGRGNGFSDDDNRAAARTAMRHYRESMIGFADEGTLDLWYESLDVQDLMNELDKKMQKRAQKGLKKAGRRTSLGSLDKLTVVVDGKRIIKERPHLIERVDVDEARLAQVSDAFKKYVASLPAERRMLAERFKYMDAAFKVVGVGSVGTRAWIIYLEGQGPGEDPLFLQFKEADRSVLETHAGKSRFKHSGHRVVDGQRLMQASSDIFLGWTTGVDGINYYGRQLRDWKGSTETETLGAKELTDYSKACGWTLARAHARSLDPAVMAGYMGKRDRFEKAMVKFAEAYADQNERDYERLINAIDSGEIEAEKGV